MQEPRISHLLPAAHLLPRQEPHACIHPFLLLRTFYSKEVRDHQLGVKWALGELGCEPLSVSCYRGCGAGACVARLGKGRPHCWASGLPPTMPPLFSNVHGNEMALGDQSSGGRLGLGTPAVSQSSSGS